MLEGEYALILFSLISTGAKPGLQSVCNSHDLLS